MRIALFAGRNIKEILRDPINLFFGLGFPLILMVLLSVINASIPPEAGNTMFAIENLAHLQGSRCLRTSVTNY